MHRNPVVRGLLANPEDWRWSNHRSLSIRRGRIGWDQELGLVGGENSEERWLRVAGVGKGPTSRKEHEKWGTRQTQKSRGQAERSLIFPH
jgi:hypothetical protein